MNANVIKVSLKSMEFAQLNVIQINFYIKENVPDAHKIEFTMEVHVFVKLILLSLADYVYPTIKQILQQIAQINNITITHNQNAYPAFLTAKNALLALTVRNAKQDFKLPSVNL